MKERPILFSAPMVRAILAGMKTQTRRVVKARKEHGGRSPDGFIRVSVGHHQDGNGGESFGAMFYAPNGTDWLIDSPYGQPGDRLWVREAFYVGVEGGPIYRACIDKGLADFIDAVRKRYGEKWIPSIHMPRWASRILLEIVDVRVERLQEISEFDAMAEGLPPAVQGNPGPYRGVPRTIEWFHDLWESINGPGSWAANPWVWVVEFRRVN